MDTKALKVMIGAIPVDRRATTLVASAAQSEEMIAEIARLTAAKDAQAPSLIAESVAGDARFTALLAALTNAKPGAGIQAYDAFVAYIDTLRAPRAAGNAKPAAYVRAIALEELADKRVAGIGCALQKHPFEGGVAIYLAPVARSAENADVQVVIDGLNNQLRNAQERISELESGARSASVQGEADDFDSAGEKEAFANWAQVEYRHRESYSKADFELGLAAWKARGIRIATTTPAPPEAPLAHSVEVTDETDELLRAYLAAASGIRKYGDHGQYREAWDKADTAIRAALATSTPAPTEDCRPDLLDAMGLDENMQPSPASKGQRSEQDAFAVLLSRFPDESSQGIMSLGDAWKAGRAFEASHTPASPVPLASGDAQPVDGVHWDLLPGFLIDHREGSTITEEGLQRAVADMLKDADYRLLAESALAAQPSQVSGAPKVQDEPVTLEAAIEAAYPVPDTHHASVIQRATDNRKAFKRGFLAAPGSAQPASETQQSECIPPFAEPAGQRDAIIAKLDRVARWINEFPIPTDGATAMMCHIHDVQKALAADASTDAASRRRAQPASLQPHWIDSPQESLGGRTAREGYAANPEYAGIVKEKP